MKLKLIRDNDIHLFEEHSSSLPVWWERHKSPRNVIYLDAHLDLQQTGADSIAALKNCTSLEQIQSLEAPNHLNPSTRFAYGIENFLYAAQRLNLISRLIWVAPAHIPRQYSNALTNYMQQMDGISFDELTGFRKVGRNALRGSLLGLDITICDYDELGALGIGENYSLDIDIDYFVEVPADRLWIDPATVITTILAHLGNPSLVTISRAVSSGFTPLAFRFVGDYIFSLLSDNKIEFDYYQKLTAAVQDFALGKLEQGQSACRRLIEKQPDLAAAHYMLALACEDANAKKGLLDAAAKCDSAYRFDLAREAIGLLHRKKPLDMDLLRRLTTTLEQTQFEPSQAQLVEIAMAQVLAASGNLKYATRLLERQTGDYTDHEDILLSIAAQQLNDPDRREQIKTLLKRVNKGVKNATIASVYLGDLEFEECNYEAALEHYLSARDRASAWMIPLERLLLAYQQLALNDKARDIEQLLISRRRQLGKVMSASSPVTAPGASRGAD